MNIFHNFRRKFTLWNKMLDHLPKYSSAVLTSIDSTGYPYSIRCTPEFDLSQQALRIMLPDYVELQNGPASLLCHTHDDLLWKLTNFVLRGTLKQMGSHWLFYPERFIGGVGVDLTSAINLIRNGRRLAKQYLVTRKLSRPDIPWDRFTTLYESIHQRL
jgi:hypothetical protein